MAFAVVADKWRVSLPDHGEVSLSFITGFAAATLFGPCFGALIAGGASLLVDLLIERRQGPAKVAFNAGQLALAGGLTGLAFQLLATDSATGLAANALAYAGAALVFVIANSALASIVLALFGRPLLRVWVRVLRDAGIFYLAMAPLGALLANAYLQSPWTLLYFPLLAWVIYRGFGLYAKLRTETQNALVALANSLERRDPYTFQHSSRVAAYSREIATCMNLPDEQLDLVVSAAQVHDLGKISIDNRILFKEGPLTDDERREVNKHSAAGAELAEQFSMYRAGAEIIRHHHERWDGSGYPDGLVGEAIPLGSRIIAVADVYDAMTSDRPYRRALSHEVAIGELVRGRGSQFDPAAVDVFLALDTVPVGHVSAAEMPAHRAQLAPTPMPRVEPEQR
jgi:putative nucleotidyltransferase with HDIG domain